MKKLALILLLFFSFPVFSADRSIGEILKEIHKKSQIEKLKKKKTNVVVNEEDEEEELINFSDIRPPKQSYSPLRISEGKAEKFVDQEIEQLFKLTKRFKTKKYRGEFWIRLGRAYLEKSAFIEERINKSYDRQAKLYQQKKTKRQPSLDLGPVYTYYEKALNLFKLYIENFPKGDKAGYALFLSGFTSMAWNKEEQALKYYQKLVKEHPKSIHVLEALFSLGDFYFERENWARAKNHYSKVLKKGKKTKFYISALYKISWCYFSLGKPSKAVQYMVKTYKESKKFSDKVNYLAEARNDLIVFYSELPNYKNAKKFLSQFFPEELMDSVIEKLAYHYSISGKRAQAVYYLRFLIKQKPLAFKAYKYQNEIVKIYSSKGGGNQHQRELYNMALLYGPNSKWLQVQENKKEKNKALRNIRRKLSNNAVKLHKAYEDTRSKKFKQWALYAYKNYFHFFKDVKGSEKLRFYYAEILFDSKQFKKSIEQYRWIIYKAPKSKYFDGALFNSLLALEKIIPSIEEIQKYKTPPKEMDLWVEAFLEIGEFYLSKTKKDNLSIKQRLAIIYYYHGQKQKALKYLKEIIASSKPDSPDFQVSFNLVVEAYNETENYTGLVSFLDKTLNSSKTMMSSDLASSIEKIRARAVFKSINQNEAQGKLGKGQAEAFEKFYKSNKNSELAYKALFNAALNYEKTKQPQKAYESYKKLSRIIPKNQEEKDFVLNSNLFLATFYGNTAQFQKQWVVFEKLSELENDKKLALDYLYNAAIIADMVGDYSGAVENYNKYYSTSRRKDRNETLFRVAKIYEKTGPPEKAISQYNKYLKSSSLNKELSVEASYRIARIYENMKQTSKANAWYKKVIKSYNNYRVGASFAAKSHFELLLKNEYEKFKKIKILRKSKNQDKVLENKLSSYNNITRDFRSVIKYDDPEMIVASLYTLGEASQNVYYFIKNAPLPKGLNKKEIREYKKAISLEAQPFDTKAKDFYRDAKNKAFELSSYEGPWLKQSFKKAEKFLTEDFIVRKEKVFTLPKFFNLQLNEKNSEKEAFIRSIHRKNYKKALELSKTILSKDPKDVDALSGLAVFYTKKRRYNLARYLLDKALKSGNSQAYLNNDLAITYLMENKYGEALKFFKKSLRDSKNSGLASLNLGALYIKNRDYQKAESALSKGLEWAKKNQEKTLNINHGDIIKIENNLAVALTANKKTDEAEKIYEKLLEALGAPIGVFVNYTILLIQLRKNEKAEEILSKINVLSNDRNILKWVSKMQKKIRSKKK